jgi:Protein of unknown function (DUF1496)
MRIPPAVAVCAAIILADVGTSTAVFAEGPTPETQNYCVFNNQLYSFGAIICIGKNRALRCDGPEPPGPSQKFRTAHWGLLQPDYKDTPYSEATLGDACSGVPSASP